MFHDQGCGIKGFIPTSVIQGNPLFTWGVGLWEALFVVSQKWSFPTALFMTVLGPFETMFLLERAGSCAPRHVWEGNYNMGVSFWGKRLLVKGKPHGNKLSLGRTLRPDMKFPLVVSPIPNQDGFGFQSWTGWVFFALLYKPLV